MRIVLCVLLGSLFACGGSDLGERCGSDDDCSGGLVCWEWPCLGDSCARSCEQGCTADEQCSDGRVCSGMLCTRVE